jgi:hypothetical protein
MKYYTGIGSRETPRDFLELFCRVAEFLSSNDFTLRSGHAEGADQAFEIGCVKADGDMEIYIPWSRFEGSTSKLYPPTEKAYDLAKQFHPYWGNLKLGGMKLQARNSHQVFGLNMDSPTQFIICWTKGGKLTGGTAQALRIANHYNIPVFNCGSYDLAYECIDDLNEFLLKYVGKEYKKYE